MLTLLKLKKTCISMINRLIRLLYIKLYSIISSSLSISSRIEYSDVSKKAKIWGKCKLYYSSVGDYSYVGSHCRVIHAHIGKFCSIAGDYSQIGMGKHSLDYLSTASIFTASKNGTGIKWTQIPVFEEYEDIIIGNDVWIGSSVKVMPGVKIGNGAVIGAGAIVTKDVPPYAIVGGVPARIIRYRFSDNIIKVLEESKWWSLPEEILKANINCFQNPLNEENLKKIVEVSKLTRNG